MKLDKDTLVKHQFWVLLGSFLVILLIAIPWLMGAAGPKIKDAQDKYKQKTDALKSAQRNPVNVTTFLPPWNEAAKEFNDHKSVIWKDAWNFQAGMYDWPPAWNNKDLTRFQTELSRDDRQDYRHKWYPEQIDNLRKYVPVWLYPVELAGGFDPIFEPVLDEKAKESWLKWQDTPTREEVWLAQEDYWVKREVFLVIWKAMADLAFMGAPEEIKEKPEGVEARYRYRNQSWEITLNLRKNKDDQLVIGGDSTIKNLDPNHRPQPLTSAKGDGILFSIVQGRTRTEFEVKGEPVGWNETRYFSMTKDGERADYEPLDSIVWEKIKERPIYVSQGFDLTNSPIRSLRKLGLGKGAQDCRTFYWRLQPNWTLAQLDALPADPNAKQDTGSGTGSGTSGNMSGGMAGGAPGGMAGGPQAGSGGGPQGGGRGRGSAAPANLTPNNQFDRDRYLQPADLDKKLNPPSRHLPLALRLVVMQSHMHDVLLALANSRLRMQITQVEFHHAKDYVPNREGENKAGDGFSRVFMGGMPGMMMYRGPGQMAPGGPPRTPGGPPGTPGGPPGTPGGPPGMGGPGPMGGSGMRMPGQMMGAPPPMMMPPPGGSGRGKFRPTLAPGMRVGGPRPMTGDSDSKQSAQNQQDDNLVEITIYGIATLYRRPDPPKPAEQPGQPGQPGQPTPPPGQQQPGRPGVQVPPPPPPAGGKR